MLYQIFILPSLKANFVLSEFGRQPMNHLNRFILAYRTNILS